MKNKHTLADNGETVLSHISGTVERVTFHNDETGFCVLKVNSPENRTVVTVIGVAPVVNAGEHIEGEGAWVNDRVHGMQFKTRQLRIVPPSTLEGIKKYLGSGMVKGIGPHFAKRLVSAFGEKVFDVIDWSKAKSAGGESLGGTKSGARYYGVFAFPWDWHCPGGAYL
jgi:exodeoxyribonuclease V alpha subunit